MRATFLMACLGLLATAAPAQLVTDPLGDGQPAEAADPQLKSLADTCAGHKFETTVVTGPGRGSKVKICGEPGESDAQWVETLKDSLRKTEDNPDMGPRVKEQIVAALTTEIARAEASAASTTKQVSASDFTHGLPAESIAPRERAPEYSSLPPLPAPKRAVPVKLANGTILPATAPAASLVKPNLTLRCAIPHESFAACSRLERESQLMVSAAEDMPAGTSLRFVRGDDNRAELDVSQLKRGESLRQRLPSPVCAGVLRGKVRVQVLTKGQVAETLGPWNLYCGS